MPDREIELVDTLIREFKTAQTLFLLFASALLMFGITLFVWQLIKSPSGLEKAVAVLSSLLGPIFGSIPASLLLGARNQKAYCIFLRAKWVDARVANDVSGLAKLTDEINAIMKETLSKPFWSK
jgi:hypothetical protein